MAKRFIDTDIFRKPFVKGLQAHHKLLWLYLLAECNIAGVWQVELDVASMRLDHDFDAEEVLTAFGDRIQAFDDGTKWFIPDFLNYQYGELNPGVRLHKSVLALLEKYSLTYIISDSPLENSSQTVKYKDKYKDIEEKGMQGEEIKPPQSPESTPQGESAFRGPKLATFLAVTNDLGLPKSQASMLWHHWEAVQWRDGANRDISRSWRLKVAIPAIRDFAGKLEHDANLAKNANPQPVKSAVPTRSQWQAAWAKLPTIGEDPGRLMPEHWDDLYTHEKHAIRRILSGKAQPVTA